jgi:hypothetical protein
MLSGQLPFWKPDVNAILDQVIGGEPTPLGPERAGRIPREVEKVIRRALSKKREDRFPTITAFARAFEAAASGAPARGARRAAPPKRGHTGLWLSLGVVAALAGAGWMFREEIMSSKWWPGGSDAASGARSAGPDHTTGDGDRPRRRSKH